MSQIGRLLLIGFIIRISFINPTKSQTVTCSQDGDICSCPFNQTFSGQTCILDCNTEDSCKTKTLYCRPNDPCQVQCTAKAACADVVNIIGGNSTDVTVICNGEDTCKAAISIECGTKDCLLTCDGKASCEDLAKDGTIDTSKSTSFQCIGECPSNIQSLQFSQAPTATPSNSPTTPTINPTQSPSTFAPSRSPLAQGQSYSPTESPSIPFEAVITDFPTINPTPSPTKNPGQVGDADPFENEVDANFSIHPLYYVIIGLLVLIFIVCCGLFCWVYSSHNRTQKMIAAQQRRLDSRSFNIYTSDGRDGHHGHLNLPSTRMSMNGELIRTDSNHNLKTTTFEKSKSPSYDINYTTDTDMRSPTNTNISRHNSAAPRVYRLQSAEATHLIPENGVKLTTAKANLPKFDQKQKQQEEMSLSQDETVTSDELRETWEVEFDDKLEEKDGEATTTGQESGDLFELMTQLMKLPETNNNINKDRTSAASLPGYHLLYHHPLYHQPWNIPKAPTMKQFKSHNAIDMKVDDGNIEQSYTNTMYTTTDIPPPPLPPTNDIPPPPPIKNNGFSRLRNKIRSNRRPIRHNSAQSMQLPHHGGLPMHQISRSWNANIADYHYNNGIFYGYAAALQHIQSLQHHNSLQLNHSNVGIPQFNKQRTHTNTRTNHGKYLLPHNEHSKTDTQNTVISDLSKHSPNDTMILHINTSDMDSGEDEADDDDVNDVNHENDEHDENVNDEELVNKDREDSQQQSQSDVTKTMSSNVNGLLPYIRSHAVVDMPPMSVDSSHIVENKNDEQRNLTEIVNENLNNIGSMSDDYDTHTTGGTTYKSSFDGSPQSPQFMIQITPEVTVSHKDNDNEDENGDKSVIINDQEPVMQLNISQQISDAKIKNVVNSIAALPENDVIDDVKNEENNEEEVDIKIEDILNEEKVNKSVEIEIPKEDSKTFKSFTMEKDDQMSECSATPIPKELVSTTTNNKSETSQTDYKSKDISRGFAIQLIGNKDEPTFTDGQSNSTVIEDTYLKYLNM